MQDYFINRYAEQVIKGQPAAFDAIEVSGLKLHAETTAYIIDNASPSKYDVALHSPEGGAKSVGEFSRFEDAHAYAKDLSAAYGWQIHTFVAAPVGFVAPVDGVFTYLDVSTAHVTEETMNVLKSLAVSGGIQGHSLAVYDLGAFITVHEDCEHADAIPADLRSVMDFAASKGCYVVRLDASGNEYEELKTYDW